MSKFWLGVVCFGAGLILVPLAAYVYLRVGEPPVAVTDQPFPFEKTIAQGALHRRVEAGMPSGEPIEPTEENLVAGAAVYREECAFCHGLPGKPSPRGKHMFPSVPQLWQPHHNAAVVGVSDDPAGETFWKVKNGIRLSGMPAYAGLLSEDQMWQVSLLVASAAKPLPAQARAELLH